MTRPYTRHVPYEYAPHQTAASRIHIGVYSFTPRQYQALSLLLQGLDYKGVARVMGIAYDTAKHYIYQIHLELGITRNMQILSRLGADAVHLYDGCEIADNAISPAASS